MIIFNFAMSPETGSETFAGFVNGSTAICSVADYIERDGRLVSLWAQH